MPKLQLELTEDEVNYLIALINIGQNVHDDRGNPTMENAMAMAKDLYELSAMMWAEDSEVAHEAWHTLADKIKPLAEATGWVAKETIDASHLN